MKPMAPMQPMQFDDAVGDVLSSLPIGNSGNNWGGAISQRQQNNGQLRIEVSQAAIQGAGSPAELTSQLENALKTAGVTSVELVIR